MTRGRTITAAVIGRAEMRAAFKHLAWNPDFWITRVVARRLVPAARGLWNAARLRRIGFMLLRVPIGRPFPDIADHVVQAEAVGRERSDGRRALEAVGSEVLVREITLPGVRHVLATRRLLIAPGEFRAVKSAACGEFPFGLGRQFLAGPARKGERVGIGDVHDWMIIEHVYVAFWTIRVPPV